MTSGSYDVSERLQANTERAAELLNTDRESMTVAESAELDALAADIAADVQIVTTRFRDAMTPLLAALVDAVRSGVNYLTQAALAAGYHSLDELVRSGAPLEQIAEIDPVPLIIAPRRDDWIAEIEPDDSTEPLIPEKEIAAMRQLLDEKR